MTYFVLVTLHLLAGAMFIGSVFFEVMVLEGARVPAGKQAMRAVESAVGKRARRVMPFVIVTLYTAGISMVVLRHGHAITHPSESAFGALLLIKVILATSVFGHFLFAVTMGALGKLRGRQSKAIHLSVFAHVVAIALLAKAMFFITW